MPPDPEGALAALGWTTFFAEAFAPYGAEGFTPARVVRQNRGSVQVAGAFGEESAGVSGRLRFRAEGPADLPAVGDWVVLRRSEGVRSTVHAVLPRRSRFARKVAGEDLEEQVVAANVDTIFLVAGLDGDFNPRRIERYLVTALDSGAQPVILLNKADVVTDLEARVRTVEESSRGVPVHAVSSRNGLGFDALRPYLAPGQTIALLGSSGVGKSTIVNRVLGGDVARTQEVRSSDSRGRHTTTHRELFVVPGGALLIDTPGMRELQLWEAGEGLEGAFEDVAALAAHCQFRDCAHGSEPGCAVGAALADGRLPAERLESFRKLRSELGRLAELQDVRARHDASKKTRALHRAARKHKPRE